jgi:hypothetical protein
MELGDTGAYSSSGQIVIIVCSGTTVPIVCSGTMVPRTGCGVPGFSTADDSNWKHQQMLQAPS